MANEPHFKDVAKKIAAFLEGCDLAGFNSMKFDIPILCEEFLRVNVDFNPARHRYVDVQVIFHKKEQRTLECSLQVLLREGAGERSQCTGRYSSYLRDTESPARQVS
ncbi:MAG: hypothetical protein MZV63_62525 [Marinilabiliales bacterium]|nr:hypothetical protein [Marinilabiliales bacterium]